MSKAYQFKLVRRTWECYLQFAQYGNGRTAIKLLDAGDHSLVAVVTANIPDEPLLPDEVIIKDYSENEGILIQLVKYGIVSGPSRLVESGYISCPVCKLLIQP